MNDFHQNLKSFVKDGARRRTHLRAKIRRKYVKRDILHKNVASEYDILHNNTAF